MKSHNSKNAEGNYSQVSGRKSELWSLLLRAAGLACGLLVCVVVLLGAANPENESEQENRKKIEAMTPAAEVAGIYMSSPKLWIWISGTLR